MKNKDLSKGELNHNHSIAKIAPNQKSASTNSMSRYYTFADSSQIGFNFKKPKYKKSKR